MFITKKRLRQLEETIDTLVQLSGMQSNINLDTYDDIKELFDTVEDNTKQIQALEERNEEDEEIWDSYQEYDEGYSDGYKKAIGEVANKKKKK